MMPKFTPDEAFTFWALLAIYALSIIGIIGILGSN